MFTPELLPTAPCTAARVAWMAMNATFTGPQSASLTLNIRKLHSFTPSLLFPAAELREDTDWMEMTEGLQRRVLREFGVPPHQVRACKCVAGVVRASFLCSLIWMSCCCRSCGVPEQQVSDGTCAAAAAQATVDAIHPLQHACSRRWHSATS